VSKAPTLIIDFDKFKGTYINRVTMVSGQVVTMVSKTTGFEEDGVLYAFDDPDSNKKGQVFIANDCQR